MSSLFLLVPLSAGLVAIAAWAFAWAVRNDQFEDLSRPARSILFDDDVARPDAHAGGTTPVAEGLAEPPTHGAGEVPH